MEKGGSQRKMDYSLLDFINDFYINRLEEGWTLTQIDETDFLHWCDLMVYKKNRDYTKQLIALDETNY